ncbi:MAG: DUF4426 domain-containing protein [Candidatus Rariloculaceae bacterium]
MIRGLHLLPILCLCLAAGCQQPADLEASLTQPVLAGTETSKDFGDYVVHFNALSSEQLTPDVARQYDIVRSDNRALLNVSIIKKEAGTLGTSVSGAVSASAINLSGQLKNISIREIREEEAIYYIGETMVSNEETLIFTIDVTPLNESSRFNIRYMKQFFID